MNGCLIVITQSSITGGMIVARVGVHLRDQVLADERRRHRKFVLHAVLVDVHLAKLSPRRRRDTR